MHYVFKCYDILKVVGDEKFKVPLTPGKQNTMLLGRNFNVFHEL